MDTHKIVVAVSGGGRSLKNLIQRQSTSRYEVIGVISSNATCGACQIARTSGLPVYTTDFNHGDFQDLAKWLHQHNPSWIVLAGFLKKFPLLPHWQERTINIHPALLPRHGGPGMYGSRVHNAVLAAGDTHTGATVHLIDAAYDQGQILAQARIRVDAATTEELAAAVFRAECDLLPKTIDWLISGQLPAQKPIIYDFTEVHYD